MTELNFRGTENEHIFFAEIRKSYLKLSVILLFKLKRVMMSETVELGKHRG